MALQFRKGAAAIDDAATKKSGGSFRPFVPRVEWREDGENKFVLVLTDIEEVVTVNLHEWIPCGKGTKANGEEYTRWESFISRKDPAIGEDYDELEERLERDAKLRCLGVMVELEPVIENVDGRKKLKSFTVKTESFTRNTDDGEVEVTAPVLGICTQSAITLWGALGSLDQSQGPLSEVPIEITRRGKDKNTRYDIIPFLEKPVDLTPLVDYIDGISYLGDDLEEVVAAVEAEETDLARAQVIASHVLSKRLDELADKERYDELVNPLKLEDMPKKFGGGGKKSKGAAKTRPERQQRPTRREAVVEADAPATEEAPAPSKNDRFAALKARVEGK